MIDGDERHGLIAFHKGDEPTLSQYARTSPLKTEEAETITSDTTTVGYSHTQKAPLCVVLYGSAWLCFTLSWVVGDTPGFYVAVAVGLV